MLRLAAPLLVLLWSLPGNSDPLFSRSTILKAAASTELEALRMAERLGAARLTPLVRRATTSPEEQRAALKLLALARDGWSSLLDVLDLIDDSSDAAIRQAGAVTANKLFAMLTPERAELDDIPLDFIEQAQSHLATLAKNRNLERP